MLTSPWEWYSSDSRSNIGPVKWVVGEPEEKFGLSSQTKIEVHILPLGPTSTVDGGKFHLRWTQPQIR